MSRDPIGYLPETWNLYEYVRCHPLNLFDPFGFEGITPIDAAVGIWHDFGCMLFGCEDGQGISIPEAFDGVKDGMWAVTGSIHRCAAKARDDAIEDGGPDAMLIGVGIGYLGEANAYWAYGQFFKDVVKPAF